MVELDKLDCKIHIEAPQSLGDTGRILSEALRGDMAAGPGSVTIHLPSAEAEFRDNEDAERLRALEFPDGFLFFRYQLELYVDSAADSQSRVSLVARILNLCWEQNWPAVAVCDYESSLPHRGGYNSRAVPWPVPPTSKTSVSSQPEFPPFRKGSRHLFTSLKIENLKVSWAGPHPWSSGYCFGSEDGRLLLTDADLRWLQPAPDRASPKRGPVNGVAFVRRWLAVSTPQEVVVLALPRHKGEQARIAEMPFGARGISAGSSGYFFAPLGVEGLMFTQPRDAPAHIVTISTGTTEKVDFHRLIVVRANAGRDVVACAIRSGGVGAMAFQGEDQQHVLSTITFDGLNVVDICPLTAAGNTTSAAAVSSDGTLILFRDVLHDHHPVTLRYATMSGSVRRLLSSRGYLFVFTDQGTYVIADLIDRFLHGSMSNAATPLMVVPTAAADANCVGDQCVLAIRPHDVVRIDMELLVRHTPMDISHGEIRDVQPVVVERSWRRREVQQRIARSPALV